MGSGGPPPLPPIRYPAWLAPPPERKPEGDGDGESYTLPPELVAGLLNAWRGSFGWGKERDRSRERGGILVRKKDGTLEWRKGKPGKEGAPGEHRSFKINYGDVRKGETLVATAHTHPFTVVEGGHTNVTFSAGDLANLVMAPEEQKFVRSGEMVFRVVKTPEFKDLMRGSVDALKAGIRATWEEAYARAEGTFAQKSEEAVKAVCRKYRLDYFKGTGDKLHKVDTSA